MQPIFMFCTALLIAIAAGFAVVHILKDSGDKYEHHERMTCYVNGKPVTHEIRWIDNYSRSNRLVIDSTVRIYDENRNFVVKYSTGTQCVKDIDTSVKIN